MLYFAACYATSMENFSRSEALSGKLLMGECQCFLPLICLKMAKKFKRLPIYHFLQKSRSKVSYLQYRLRFSKFVLNTQLRIYR